jgi:hypothetical protein
MEKSEAQNPKSETNPNAQIRKQTDHLGFGIFFLGISFGFRASDFGFRISAPA